MPFDMEIGTEDTWKDIPDYEVLYAVSSFGRIRSYDRLIDRSGSGFGSYTLRGRIIKSRIDSDGYVIVDLNAGSEKKTFKVHRLVAEAFIPNPENLPHVDHSDGDRANNHLANLKWSTVKENLLNRHNIKQASGVRGVRLNHRGKYQAYCHNHQTGKFVHIGVFESVEAASVARQAFIHERADVSTR